MLATLFPEEERQEEERRIASLKLFNAIQAKVEGQLRRCRHMETIINGKPLQAMLDMVADRVYMAKELTDEVASFPTPRRKAQ